MGDFTRGLTFSTQVDEAFSTCVLVVEGEADLASLAHLQTALEVAAASECETVVIDGSRLRFLDLHCLRALVAFHANLEATGRRSVLSRAQPIVRTLLRVIETPLQILDDPPPGRDT